ncbi:Cyanovirin-N [Chaetomium sp. MPI-CAGE-AT-0009]|nr:Cyanovirin-N [Chaetomium sp. MPI-CAGE-AT-0009]
MSSFHHSAEDVRLDYGHMLWARLRNAEGQWVETVVDLNEYLGNDDGRFKWGGMAFSESATNIRLELEGSEKVPILRATLNDKRRQKKEADINLGDRIANVDGKFELY